MPNDARLGLVVGVTLVILVAVLFARKDGGAPGTAGAVQATPPSSTGTGSPVPGISGPTKGRVPGLPRTHTVEEGETLMSLAVRYYGEPTHVSFLFRSNMDRIIAPDRLPIGTVLRVPELPKELASKTGR